MSTKEKIDSLKGDEKDKDVKTSDELSEDNKDLEKDDVSEEIDDEDDSLSEEEDKKDDKDKKDKKKKDDDDDEDDDDEDDDEDEDDSKKESVNIDVTSDISALVEGEELSESFKEKATLLYKTSIESKYNELKESLEEDYEEKLVENVQSIEEDLMNKVDKFLDYVVEEWMNENKIAVETGIRTEVAESFITSLKNVFTEHYVDVPEGKEDLVETLQTESTENKSKLDESIAKNIELSNEVKSLKKEKAISEMSEGLTVSQTEKLNSLLESVDFDDEFNNKAKIIKESHFAKNETTDSAQEETPSSLTEEHSKSKSTMDRYAEYIRSNAKK